MKSDRQVILSLIACPNLNVGMQNSQFYHKAVISPRPINSEAVDEAESKSHDVAENKKAKIVVVQNLKLSFFSYIGIPI